MRMQDQEKLIGRYKHAGENLDQLIKALRSDLKEQTAMKDFEFKFSISQILGAQTPINDLLAIGAEAVYRLATSPDPISGLEPISFQVGEEVGGMVVTNGGEGCTEEKQEEANGETKG